MPTVAYIANQFPSPVEPYVVEEILELRGRGVVVIPCSARSTSVASDDGLLPLQAETLHLQPLRIGLLICAAWLCLRKFNLLVDLIERVLVQGDESPGRRLRALLHTWLGAYYALQLERRGVQHIHVHHGYFAAWIAMVAARLLGISFSMTLHGSDLLLHHAFLDTKIKHCKFCVTVSEFNRQHILSRYAGVEPEKVIVLRMGVDPASRTLPLPQTGRAATCLIMMAVGRLHPVKNHAFLLRACRQLKDRGVRFLCLIAGEGPERPNLEHLIGDLGLAEMVKLLGHLPRRQLDAYYATCDLVVLTSCSEGIPLVLMEAMAHGRAVLAPAITGIPELVVDGKTGFLYQPGSLEDFVARVRMIRNSRAGLGPLRRAARQHVIEHFSREKTLAAFGDVFLARIAGSMETHRDENPVLQQV
jgi:colanic acid/amylovoran biosynthesis glycosyltransferase